MAQEGIEAASSSLGQQGHRAPEAGAEDALRGLVVLLQDIGALDVLKYVDDGGAALAGDGGYRGDQFVDLNIEEISTEVFGLVVNSTEVEGLQAEGGGGLPGAGSVLEADPTQGSP